MNNFDDNKFSKDLEKTMAIDLAKEFAERRIKTEKSNKINNYFAESFDPKCDKFIAEKKRKHYKLSVMYIIIILMLAVVVASWFINGHEIQRVGEADYDIINNGTAKLGLFDIFASLYKTFIADGHLIWFLLASSGMVGVFLRTGTLQSTLSKFVNQSFFTPGRLLALTIVFISTLSVLFNANYLIISMAVIVVPLFVFKGYDIVTPILALMLGTAAGMSSSLFVNHILVDWIESLGQAGITADIDTLTGAWLRLIVWVVMTIVAILVTHSYGKKVLDNPDKGLAKYETDKFLEVQSDILGTANRDEQTSSRRWILITVGISMLIIIIGVIPLHEFGFTFLNDWSAGWENNDWARAIYGSDMRAIGEWEKQEITVIFILTTIVIGVVNHTTQQQVIKGFTRGMGSATKLMLILILSGALYQLFMDSGIHVKFSYDTLNNIVEQSTMWKATSVFTMSMVGSLFMPIIENSTVFFGYIMQASLNGSDTSADYLVFLGTAITAGTSALQAILPTSAVLIGTLWAYKVGYKQWVKSVWKHVTIFALSSMILIGAISVALTWWS